MNPWCEGVGHSHEVVAHIVKSLPSYLHDCSGCFRLERLSGIAPTGKRRLFTAHPSRRGPAVRPVKGQEAPISRQDQGPAAPVRRAVFCDAVQLTEAANSAT